MSQSGAMVDSHGRRIKKLRFSLNDACNMRCLYCMPPDKKYCFTKELLSPTEISRICGNLTRFGIEEIRLTGGEPLLRPDFLEIARLLSPLNLKKLGVTTNGILLEKLLPKLLETNLRHINISLDSLSPQTFKSVTNLDSLPKTLRSIETAKKLGFKVKLNTVLLRDINFSEVFDFIEYASETGIEVRFLELMKIGAGNTYHENHFVKAQEVISAIKKVWNMEEVPSPVDSTSFNFRLKKGSKTANIGFIASESRPFCNSCSRLRVTPKGELRPCIMVDAGPSLKGLGAESYPDLLAAIIEEKPTHRLPSYQMGMNEIGG